jgi:hypothetical protein
MLECPSLRLLAWSVEASAATSNEPGQGRAPRRGIFDAATELPVGYVCWNESPNSGWLKWLLSHRLVLEIHEKEDDSLLFTMHGRRRWAIPLRTSHWRAPGLSAACRWEVRDAEGLRVGTVERSSVSALTIPESSPDETTRKVSATLARGRAGRCFVVKDLVHEQSKQAIWAAPVPQSGSWTQGGNLSRMQEEIVLEFATGLQADPFAKMLLLAALIAATNEMTR